MFCIENKILPACYVSIVIPVRDEALHLEKTLATFVRQFDLNGKILNPDLFELIVLTNNCSDNSYEIACKFQAENKFLNLNIADITTVEQNANSGFIRCLLMQKAYGRLISNNNSNGIIMTTDGSTPSGLAHGAAAGAYSLSDMDVVNFYNGNLNFNLPLLKVGGRGSAMTALNFSLNSKSWRVKHYEGYVPDTGQVPTPVTADIPDPSAWQQQTYDTEYSPGMLVGRHVGGTSTITCPSPSGGDYHNVNRITLTRLTFTSPDGTEFELRDQLTDGEPKYTANPCTSDFYTFNRGKVFVSRDGSGGNFHFRHRYSGFQSLCQNHQTFRLYAFR